MTSPCTCRATVRGYTRDVTCPIHGNPFVGPRRLRILVPRVGTWAHARIQRASALVALEDDVDPVDVYYEGNIYHAANLQAFDARVATAAGRLLMRYPTIARGSFARADLVDVGWCALAPSGTVTGIDIVDRETLAQWTEHRK